MDYLLNGPVLLKAKEIEEELKKGAPKPFEKVITMNIGDAQAMGQTPITFIRQILATVTYPKLLEDPTIPDDVKWRAEEILESCRGNSIGSYTYPPGIEIVRKRIAEFIEARDGIPSDWQNVFLSSGASEGIRKFLHLFTDFASEKKPGILYPVPEYPIYSGTIKDFNMERLEYYLDECNGWELNIEELAKLVNESRKTCNPKVLVVINPGNPTGQLIPRKNIEEIVKFAHKENLFLLADEVYQQNVYTDKIEFVSFKKVMSEMGSPYSSMPLASFMSSSKGYMSECGIRGGYCELINAPPEMKPKIAPSLISTLCPTSLGQIAVYCTVNPPKEGEPSYDLFLKEKNEFLESLKIKAEMVTESFNKFEGYSCNEVQGSMYAFPRIKFSKKAIEAAEKAGTLVDEFYALRLLEETGVCVIPGLGFGQKEDTYHFRSTILPSVAVLEETLELIRKFNEKFFNEYR